MSYEYFKRMAKDAIEDAGEEVAVSLNADTYKQLLRSIILKMEQVGRDHRHKAIEVVSKNDREIMNMQFTAEDAE